MWDRDIQAQLKTGFRLYLLRLAAAHRVDHTSVQFLLAQTLIYQLLDMMGSFLTEQDYNELMKFADGIMTGGSCLAPYSAYCADRATLGEPLLMGDVQIRSSEQDDIRKTQDEQLRRTE